MRLRELELLQAMISFGSVSDAARALHMTQPNASKMLKKLEHQFGFLLFERVNGRLHPTAEARMLSDPVERATLSVKSFARLVEEVREMHTGRLMIGGLPLLSREWLPDVLSGFIAAHPGVAVSFHTRSSKHLIEWVAERQIDLAVSMLTPDDPMVERTVLTPIEMVVALPAGHRLVEREVVTAADLDGEDFISLGVLDRSRAVIDQVFAEAGAVPAERAECSLPAVAVEFVERGVGAALVDHITAREYRGDRVVFRRFERRVTMDIWLLRPRMRPRSRIVDAFVEMLRSRVEQDRLADATLLP